MQNKGAGKVHDLPQNLSSKPSMEVVVILAQQRDAMLRERLDRIDAIDLALRRWGEERGVQSSSRSDPK